MANYDVDSNQGIVDKRKLAKHTAASVAPNLATPANYTSINALRTRLAAANGAYYTTARLDQMSENDMIYALRTIDDAAGL
jgi:hypothetical protein